MYLHYQWHHIWSSGGPFPTGDGRHRRINLWHRFTRWLMEPIDFPGKLPREVDESSEYNLLSDQHPQLSHDLNERRPPQPR
jgi:hypothetical protein